MPLYYFLLKPISGQHFNKISLRKEVDNVAGRFINTDRTGVLTQQSVSNTMAANIKGILNNPYYLHSDKRALQCTYFNINTTMTTLDEATKGNYGEISPDSPLRYNKISGFYIYGMSKIEPNYEVGEFGVEGSDISGDAVILPYTVVPYPGDCFILDDITKISKGKMMFQITGVDPNTLDTGAVMYKVSYNVISTDGIENIEHQVVRRMKFMLGHTGTNFATFMDEVIYSEAKDIETISTMLKDYYMSLFYDPKIQSFAYLYSNNGTIGGSIENQYGYHEMMGFNVYDPYLIEFMIRNKIMTGSTNYIFITHQTVMPTTFPIDYDRTIFSSLERKDIKNHIGTYIGNMIKCDQPLSLLYAYPIDYYCMEYRTLERGLFVINIFDDPEFGEMIKANRKIDDSSAILKNIIIKFFNNEEINLELLKSLYHINYLQNKELFYLIPMAIFCIDKTLEGIASKTSI